MHASNTIEQLRNLFAQQENIELALLIGSRALGRAREDSDWDFAVQWHRDIPWGDALEYTETLRADLARLLQTTQDQIDMVDIPAARLAMHAVIAEEGLLLKGENTLPWSHFLLKTWRDLEDFYWAKEHAA
ncbi:MAG: nucleotidyltransferase domain-containing protein [Gammaproteobacteria bacterium]|nr:nucleotidyltransferase domain-containing protein [Gammaproteobacteria bacterium]